MFIVYIIYLGGDASIFETSLRTDGVGCGNGFNTSIRDSSTHTAIESSAVNTPTAIESSATNETHKRKEQPEEEAKVVRAGDESDTTTTQV